MNPVHFGLEMLFRSVGMEMVKLETSEEFYRLHGFCARTDSKQVNLETKVYLIWALKKVESNKLFIR